MTRTADSPVFVLGCARSGTTLLYHMILSAGGFAVYRAESHAYDVLVPRFGGLRSARARRALLRAWGRTSAFHALGVEMNALSERILTECSNGGDFLRIVMESVAESQGVRRWADCTPRHLLHIAEICRDLPEARIIHIVRDGRDVAISLEKQGWVKPLPWERGRARLACALNWEWTVQAGRRWGAQIGDAYLEVRFEDLVTDPLPVLNRIGHFIGQHLDYGTIRDAAIGSVSRPNTSFRDSGQPFQPVGRWREVQTHEETQVIEAAIGGSLRCFGYQVATLPDPDLARRMRRIRSIYHALFSAKHSLKTRTPLGRLTDLSPLDGWDLAPEPEWVA